MGKFALSEDQQKELSDKVLDEIRRHQLGEEIKLTQNNELAELFGISRRTADIYLSRIIKDDDDRKYRKAILLRENARRRNELHGNPLDNLTLEQRRENGIKSGRRSMANLTPEQRSELGRKGYEKGFGNLTLEQKRENGKKGGRRCIELHGNPSANLTPEQRRENSRKAGKRSIELHGNPSANQTLEQRRENGIKGGRRRIELHGNPSANQTPEQRRENGRKGGRRCIELHGNPLANQTPEQRRENARRRNELHGNPFANLTLEQRREMIRRRIELYGSPFANQTPEQRRENGRKGADSLRRKRISYECIYYDSLSEAVCSILMQKYISGFEIKIGETYQINKSLGKSIDFLVDGVFFEWHPILTFFKKYRTSKIGEFQTLEDYLEYKQIKESLKGEERKQYEEQTKQQLKKQYLDSRIEAIEQSDYKGRELILASTPEEFYELVIKRLGIDYPTRDKFIEEFNEVKKQIKKHQKAPLNND